MTIDVSTIISVVAVVAVIAAVAQLIRDRKQLKLERGRRGLTTRDLSDIAWTLRSQGFVDTLNLKTVPEMEAKIRELELEVVRLRTIIETFGISRGSENGREDNRNG